MENWKLFLKNEIHMQKIELSSNIAGGLDFSIQAIKRHTITHRLIITQIISTFSLREAEKKVHPLVAGPLRGINLSIYQSVNL